MVDVQSIGAGGGSIARVESGALQVGPAERRRRARTDLLRPRRHRADGDRRQPGARLSQPRPLLRRHHAARRGVGACRDRRARRAARSASRCSRRRDGIFRLVNANMANAIRQVSARRGVDPRALTLVAYGGNGPVHAGMQAAELGIGRVLVPKLSPAFSALGLLLTDHVVDEMRSYIAPIGQVDLARVEPPVRGDGGIGAGGAGRRRPRAPPAHRARWPRSATRGRRSTWRCRCRTPRSADGARARGHRRALPPHARGAAHLRLPRRGADPARPAPEGRRRWTASPSCRARRARRGADARLGVRTAYFGGRATATPVYDGSRLASGQAIAGPAIVEEPFTTIVVYPGQRATVDPYGNYVLTLR